MFWFDKADQRATFQDNRRESHQLKDKSSKGGFRELLIDPDVQCDFTNMPYEDSSFSLVVFDPPHLLNNGRTGWLAKKYGKLEKGWHEELRDGFVECFRVLKPEGNLIFKWNETDIPVSHILALTDQKPLFGHRCGKLNKSHWLVFSKPA